MEKISVLIADDHKLIRDTWSFILNNDPRFQVIAECGDSEQAVEAARLKRPNIVLMDINMMPISGFEATEKIRKVSPASKIIGVSMHSQPAYAKKMLQIGARGYVTKNSSKEEMMKAILEVHQGNKYICEEIKNNISELVLEENRDVPNVNALTEREIQIINLIWGADETMMIFFGSSLASIVMMLCLNVVPLTMESSITTSVSTFF